MNVRQADAPGLVHVTKPGTQETYCGLAIDEEVWVATSKEANCDACARTGAPMSEGPRAVSGEARGAHDPGER